MHPERPFQYVPAAITSGAAHQFAAVKYGDFRKDPMLWQRTRFNGLTTEVYPDRTLYIGSTLRKSSSISDVDYDEMVITSYATHMTTLKDLGYRYGMASPHHISNATETRRNKHIKLFSDSGGFQLLTGVVDFIDPLELAAYYNKTVDYGIGLDIPVFGNNDMLMRMIEIMLVNNRLIRKHLVPEAQIYDVSHGSTLKTRAQFLDRLLKEKELGEGLAIGGIAQNFKDGGMRVTTATGTVNLLYTLLKTKGRFKRYHVLGTTSSFFQALYWLIQEYEVAPHITADSTTYVQAPVNNLMLNSKLRSLLLSSTDLPKEHWRTALHCPCALCSIVKYPIAYVRTAALNVFHGLSAIADNCNMIEDSVRDFHDGKMSLQKLASMLGDQSMTRFYVQVMEFALDAARKGFKTAYEKHYPTLKPFLRGATNTGSLFGERQRVLTPDQQKVRTRLDSVLTKYEDYHKGKKKVKS